MSLPTPDEVVFRRGSFDWARTYVMGVVNVTPDSFSDGGTWFDTEAAFRHGLRLLEQGADLLDIGGESTRPGAAPVSADEEKRRVLPVVHALAERALTSIDTYKAEVADEALAAGAEIVNDVAGGLLDPELLKVVGRRSAVVILGHLRGDPLHMSEHALYKDVVAEVVAELASRIDAARVAGVTPSRIWIDPGLGFAKRAEHNLALLAHLKELAALGHPVVVGASRKSFLGQVIGKASSDREVGTAAAHTAAILHGAHLVRVHSVHAQIDAVRVADAVKRAW